MSDRSAAIRLFVTCWVVSGAHFATNTVREIYPALSLADHGSFNVSEYVGFHDDVFTMPDGRAFINNNPGASIIGAVPYLIARPVTDRIIERVQRQRAAAGPQPEPQFDSPWPMAREFYRKSRERGFDIKFGLAAGLMSVFAMAPLSALSAVVMFFLLRAMSTRRRAAALLAVLYVVATPVLFRSAQLNQNLLVADLALFAFAALWRPWAGLSRPHYLLAGLLAGWAVVCDYSALVVVVVLAAYALMRRRELPADQRRTSDPWRFLAGLSVGAAVLMAYQWNSFGNPILPAQHYMPAAHHSERGYSGFDWPQADLLWATAFDARFGLFTSAPLLLLSLWPGWMRRTGAFRMPEIVCIIAMTLGMFVFCSANQYGRMQFNCGVRHVVPAVPFMFLAAAQVLRQMPPTAAVIVGVLSVGWTWCLAMYRDVEVGRGVLECVIQIVTGGPRLPWLTTVQRMGIRPGGLSAVAMSSIALIAVAGLVAALWRVRSRDRSWSRGSAA